MGAVHAASTCFRPAPGRDLGLPHIPATGHPAFADLCGSPTTPLVTGRGWSRACQVPRWPLIPSFLTIPHTRTTPRVGNRTVFPSREPTASLHGLPVSAGGRSGETTPSRPTERSTLFQYEKDLPLHRFGRSGTGVRRPVPDCLYCHHLTHPWRSGRPIGLFHSSTEMPPGRVQSAPGGGQSPAGAGCAAYSSRAGQACPALAGV